MSDPRKCIQCGKPWNENFYDKALYGGRPVCSRECYSKYFTEWSGRNSRIMSTSDDYYIKNKERIKQQQAIYRQNRRIAMGQLQEV